MINCFFSLKKFVVAGLLLLGAQTAFFAQNLEFPVLDTLPTLDSLDDFAVNDQARLLANRAAEIQQVYQQQADNAAANRSTLEQQLAAAKTDSTATPEFKKELERALKSAKKDEKAAQKQAQKAQKTQDFAEQVADAEPKDQRRYLYKVHSTVAALLPEPPKPEEPPIAAVIGSVAVDGPPDLAAPTPTVDTTAVSPPPVDSTMAGTQPEENPAAKRKKEKKAAASKPVFKTYQLADDVMLNPPAQTCRLTVDTRDEFSGERRREVAAEELFRFTTPALRPYLQDRDHIICTANLSTANGAYLLNLTFTINDINARRAFGSLPRNGVAILKLLDGETFTLYNLKTDEGQPDASNTAYTFRGQYSIDPGMFKKLQKTLFDKVRIAWSTGYEDYEVYNVDLLVRQLSCLLKN